MKKLTFILTTILIVGYSCKSKKSTTSTTSRDPTQDDLPAVQPRIPDASMNDLKQGHSIFYGACTRCHGAKNVSDFSEEKLKSVIERMSKKAKLTEPEKDAVWKFALAKNLNKTH